MCIRDRAKGMPNRRVLWRYAARNAVLPQIQSFALALGFIAVSYTHLRAHETQWRISFGGVCW